MEGEKTEEDNDHVRVRGRLDFETRAACCVADHLSVVAFGRWTVGRRLPLFFPSAIVMVKWVLLLLN